MRVIGHVLMWSGFLAGAYASVCRLEQPDKWATIPWLWYSLAVAIGIVGIVLLRLAKREEQSNDAKTDAEFTVVRESLAAITALVGELAQRDSHVPSSVVRTIDEQCADPLQRFADARESMIRRFGLQVYADVMTEFAAGERYVNRSWSAAADGYVDEVAVSLQRANEHLKQAGILIAAAEQQRQP